MKKYLDIGSGKGLVDSNLLVYAHDLESKFNASAKSWLETTSLDGNLYISWQNILEFYSIITNPKRSSRPLKPKDAIEVVGTLQKSLEIIYPNRNSENFFLKILNKTKPRGAEIYDHYLASVVLGNGLEVVYTLNIKDFAQIPGIKAINPL